MKYAVILGDGMADRSIPGLGGKTPLEYANIPNMNRLAALGQTGLVKTVPTGFKPGSDVANLSVIGFPPEKYYTGRSPLEALSIGIDMKDTDVAVRCNLVTLSEGADPVMEDYSAGEISTDEAKELIEAVQKALGNDEFSFYCGVSYRHCLIWNNGTTAAKLTPPHDISGRKINDYLPSGEGGEKLKALIEASAAVLKNHPVNQKRRAEGKRPATHIWLWGAGKKPKLDSFFEKYGLQGTVISAVDLLKGIALGSGMAAPDVPGANGTLSTNFDGKIAAAIQAFQNGGDYVYLHIEAPDECGHQGDVLGKVKAIEKVDYVLKKVWDYLESRGEDYVIALLPDHATPIEIKTHSAEPVPYVIYQSGNPLHSGLQYNETSARGGIYLPEGQDIIKRMLERSI